MSLPILKVRLNNEIFDIVVCWSEEKTKLAAAKFDDGIIDLDKVLAGKIEITLSNKLELQYITNIVRYLEAKTKAGNKFVPLSAEITKPIDIAS